MIKCLLILLTVVCVAGTANSQTYYPFPDSGAVWSVLIEGQSMTVPYQSHHRTFTLGGDTVIGQYTYKKITPSDVGAEEGAIREDTTNHRIYFTGYCSGWHTDALLYDFNLQVGDTAATPFNVCTVYNIDSVLILGQFRKRIQLICGTGYDEWIEGIGSTNHPLMPLQPGEFEGNWTLMCLQDDTSGIYIRYAVTSNNGPWYPVLHPGFCGLTSWGTGYTAPGVSISVKENTLHVAAPLFYPTCNYVIYDINGREVFANTGSNYIAIGLHELNTGVYIIQVTDQSGNFFSQKFLVQ